MRGMRAGADRDGGAMKRAAAGVVAVVVMLATVAAGAAPPDATAERMRGLRERMALEDIAAGGVTDPRVLESLRTTPRHEFVPPPQRHLAYVDMALPIGEKQTISGPFVVAYMTERLEPRPTDRVLEIGTGSGYQAAVLSPLVKTVYSIEINKPLGEKAARILTRLGYKNVVTKIGDGFQGWPEHAPFDKIIVTCSPEEIPKRDGEMVRESLVPSLFVPMTGEAEEARVVQPDGTRPAIGNGGFEELLPGAEVPTAWYYGRQMEMVEAPDAPEGGRFLRLENAEKGRPAQLFQGFAVDGRAIGRLAVALEVRGESIREGHSPEELPALGVQFFDERRSRSSRALLPVGKGTFPWRRVQGTLTVPVWAREAIALVGMLGSTGRLEADDVRIEGVAR